MKCASPSKTELSMVNLILSDVQYSRAWSGKLLRISPRPDGTPRA
jgi:hypothetical protein